MGHCMKIDMILLDSLNYLKLFLIGNARVLKCCPTLLLYGGKVVAVQMIKSCDACTNVVYSPELIRLIVPHFCNTMCCN